MRSRQLPHDSALPSLATLFDMERMTGRLGSWIRRACADRTVVGCDIERVKYRPGRNCMVSYRLRTTLSGKPAGQAMRATVTTYPAAELEHRFEQAWGHMAATTALPAPMLFGDIDSLVVPFPLDRKLAALAELVSSPALAAAAAGVRDHARRVGAASNWSGTQEVVSYFPGHSCTVRVELAQSPGSEGDVVPHVYGKVSYSEAGANALRGMAALNALQGSMPNLGSALALEYDAARRILWQAGITAPTLADCASSSTRDLPLWRRVGAATAQLHASAVGGGTRLTLPALCDSIERGRDLVCSASPGLARAADSLALRLLVGAVDIDADPTATLHGDLHSRNVLVGDDRLYFIDLDRIGQGPAIAELGSLIAERIASDCVLGRPADLPVVHAIVSGYQRHSSLAIPRDQLDWHVAAALLRERAARAVTSLKPGRFESLPALIRTADGILRGTLDLLPPAQSVRGRALAREAS